MRNVTLSILRQHLKLCIV